MSPFSLQIGQGEDLRIRQIRFPQARTAYRTMLIILVACGVIMLVVWYATQVSFGATLPILYMLGSIGTYLALVAGVSFGVWHQRQLRLNVPRQRFDRLKRVMQRPDVVARLPHRVIEYHCRKSPDRIIARVTRVLKQISAGTVIVANRPAGVVGLLPGRSSVAFEPMSLSRRDPGLVDVAQLGMTALAETSLDQIIRATDRDARASKTGGRAKRSVSMLYAILTFVAFMVSLGFQIASNLVMSVMIYSGVALIILAVVCVGPLLGAREWWLVPGGVVSRRMPLWRSRPHLLYIRAAQAVLFMDSRSHDCRIVHRGKVFAVLPVGFLGRSALLSGWLSQARPPTDEEISAFLGGGSGTLHQ